MPDPQRVSMDLRAIASAGLRDEPIRVDADRWADVLRGITGHRLTGIASSASETGQLLLDPDQEKELRERHRAVMADALRIEQQLLRLYDAFTTDGIGVVVLKGSAVAHTVYPDPAMRPFGDLDLMVSTTDWQAACRTLRRTGFTRDLPEPRPGFDERFGKAATHSDASGLQVDLHRTLVVGPFGLWLDPEVVLQHADTFELGGTAVPRLDATGMLLNAALHAGLGTSSPLFLPLRDVVEAARSPEVDWDLLRSWADKWRLSAPFAHAFSKASAILGASLPAEARAFSMGSSPRSERRAMRAYAERRLYGGVAVATMAAIPGLRAKASYVFGLAMPRREFMAARATDGVRTSYVSRWRVPVGWVVRRARSASRSEGTAALRRHGGRG